MLILKKDVESGFAKTKGDKYKNLHLFSQR